MKTVTLSPASQEKLRRLVAEMQAAQNRANEFLMDTAAALGVDPKEAEFNIQTMTFYPKALLPTPTTDTPAAPAAPEQPTPAALDG